jgi:REP element-mobilizing transposase RayT
MPLLFPGFSPNTSKFRPPLVRNAEALIFIVGAGVPAGPLPPILTTYTGKLPHWRMDGSVYFVSWRLAAKQALLQPAERTLVADAIKHFAGERYGLWAYVVMDDHVHALVTPSDGFPLQEIVHTWKSFTTNRLQRDFHRLGLIWQREYFDRIVRDEGELVAKINYILDNPEKRWPDIEEYEWVGCDLSLMDDVGVGPV